MRPCYDSCRVVFRIGKRMKDDTPHDATSRCRLQPHSTIPEVLPWCAAVWGISYIVRSVCVRGEARENVMVRVRPIRDNSIIYVCDHSLVDPPVLTASKHLMPQLSLVARHDLPLHACAGGIVALCLTTRCPSSRSRHRRRRSQMKHARCCSATSCLAMSSRPRPCRPSDSTMSLQDSCVAG